VSTTSSRSARSGTSATPRLPGRGHGLGYDVGESDHHHVHFVFDLPDALASKRHAAQQPRRFSRNLAQFCQRFRRRQFTSSLRELVLVVQMRPISGRVYRAIIRSCQRSAFSDQQFSPHVFADR